MLTAVIVIVILVAAIGPIFLRKDRPTGGTGPGNEEPPRPPTPGFGPY